MKPTRRTTYWKNRARKAEHRALIAEEHLHAARQLSGIVLPNGDVAIYNGSGGLPKLVVPHDLNSRQVNA